MRTKSSPRLALGPAILLSIWAAGAILLAPSWSQCKIIELHFKPSMTDVSIHLADTPHMAVYDPLRRISKLMVYLKGSDDGHQEASTEFYKTLVGLGYQVISLTYVTAPTVTSVCKRANSGDSPNRDSKCAEKARRNRCFGNDSSMLIMDAPADSISNRLKKALEYLARTDSVGEWSQYLGKDGLNWNKIGFTGQGEGGAMAAYIAKAHALARVVIFSIAKDDGETADSLAEWYAQVAETPKEHWYAGYHYLEPNPKTLSDIYRVLRIPDSHVVILHEKVPKGMRIHPAAVGNPAYRPQWVRLFGS